MTLKYVTCRKTAKRKYTGLQPQQLCEAENARDSSHSHSENIDDARIFDLSQNNKTEAHGTAAAAT